MFCVGLSFSDNTDQSTAFVWRWFVKKCMYVFMYVCIYVCMYVCMCVYIYIVPPPQRPRPAEPTSPAGDVTRLEASLPSFFVLLFFFVYAKFVFTAY